MRYLFWDLLRIAAILAIVAHHLRFWLPWVAATRLDLGPFGDYGIGPVAVWLIIIVSGAALNFSAFNLRKRFWRLYPAYWASLVLAIVVSQKLKWSYADLFGMAAFSQAWKDSTLSGVSWFIGLIAILYLMYPILAEMLRRYPWQGIALLFLVSFGFKYIFSHYGFLGMWLPYYTFPLCNVGFFGLGILAGQKGWYPRWHTPKAVCFLAELSFYVFLTHELITRFWKISPPLYVALVLLLSLGLWVVDEKIQANRECLESAIVQRSWERFR
jgi:peptidoglycan/LPS O-acetylase OafA/YrhL